jgi:hypothetical protein
MTGSSTHSASADATRLGHDMDYAPEQLLSDRWVCRRCDRVAFEDCEGIWGAATTTPCTNPCPNCSATLYTHHHVECPRWGTEPPWEPISSDWQLGRDDSVTLAKSAEGAPPAEAGEQR